MTQGSLLVTQTSCDAAPEVCLPMFSHCMQVRHSTNSSEPHVHGAEKKRAQLSVARPGQEYVSCHAQPQGKQCPCLQSSEMCNVQQHLVRPAKGRCTGHTTTAWVCLHLCRCQVLPRTVPLTLQLRSRQRSPQALFPSPRDCVSPAQSPSHRRLKSAMITGFKSSLLAELTACQTCSGIFALPPTT